MVYKSDRNFAQMEGEMNGSTELIQCPYIRRGESMVLSELS